MNEGLGVTGNYSRGFTILEVLIAIAILAVGLLGMASLSGSIISYNQLAQQVTAATTLAQDKIEELSGCPYDTVAEGTVAENNIDAGADAGGMYNRSTEVAKIDPGDPGYSNTKTIEVTVSWGWRGSTHNVVLKKIITR